MCKKTKLAALIFLIVFLPLSLLYYAIGFDSDSVGFVYECLNNPCSWDIFWKPINNAFLSSGSVTDGGSFFSTMYRPLGFLGFHIMTKIFGANPIPFNIVYFFFHGVVSVVFFYLLSQMLPLVEAFLLAVLFAFHPGHYHETIGIMHSSFGVYFFLGLALVCWIKYRQTEKMYWQILSALLYGASLLSYEQPLVFIGVAVLYYAVFHNFQKVKQLWIYVVVASIYIAIRFTLLGVNNNHGSDTILNLLYAILSRRTLDSWLFLIRPFFGLYNYAHTTMVIVLTVIAFLIVYGFLVGQRESKKRILFAIIAFFLLSWPIFVIGSSAHFLYTPILFFCFFFYEGLVNVFKKFYQNYQPYVRVVLLLILMRSFFYAHTALSERVRYTTIRDTAYKDVAQRYDAMNKILILGHLSSINNQAYLMQTGIAQGIKLYTKNDDAKILHWVVAKIECQGEKFSSFTIVSVPQGFRFISTDEANLYFFCPSEGSNNNIMVHRRGRKHWQVTDVSFVFDKQLIIDAKDSVILSFDPKKQCFVELNGSHLK